MREAWPQKCLRPNPGFCYLSLCRSALRPPLPPLHMSQRLYSAAMSWVRLRSTISTHSRRQTLQNNQISDLAEHLQTKPKDGASAVGEQSPVIFYNPSTDVKSIQQKSLSSYLNIINVWNLVLLVLLAKYFRYFEWSVIFFEILTNKKTFILESNYDVYEDKNWLWKVFAIPSNGFLFDY